MCWHEDNSNLFQPQDVDISFWPSYSPRRPQKSLCKTITHSSNLIVVWVKNYKEESHSHGPHSSLFHSFSLSRVNIYFSFLHTNHLTVILHSSVQNHIQSGSKWDDSLLQTHPRIWPWPLPWSESLSNLHWFMVITLLCLPLPVSSQWDPSKHGSSSVDPLLISLWWQVIS